MCDLGYNWSFSLNLEDLHDFYQSRKEEYYPLGKNQEICGSTISKPQIHDFRNRKLYDGEAIVYVTKKEGNWIIIQSRGIQTDLTPGTWGSITCHHINVIYF